MSLHQAEPLAPEARRRLRVVAHYLQVLVMELNRAADLLHAVEARAQEAPLRANERLPPEGSARSPLSGPLRPPTANDGGFHHSGGASARLGSLDRARAGQAGLEPARDGFPWLSPQFGLVEAGLAPAGATSLLGWGANGALYIRRGRHPYVKIAPLIRRCR